MQDLSAKIREAFARFDHDHSGTIDIQVYSMNARQNRCLFAACTTIQLQIRRCSRCPAGKRALPGWRNQPVAVPAESVCLALHISAAHSVTFGNPARRLEAGQRAEKTGRQSDRREWLQPCFRSCDENSCTPTNEMREGRLRSHACTRTLKDTRAPRPARTHAHTQTGAPRPDDGDRRRADQ